MSPRLAVAGLWDTDGLGVVAGLDVSRFGTLGGVGFLPITSANEINFNCLGKDSDPSLFVTVLKGILP